MKLKTQFMAPLRAGAVLLALAGAASVGVSQAQTTPVKAKFHAKISKKQAKRTVLAQFPGKIVGKIALENEDGVMQYAVNVRSGKILREVMVDATTGKIADIEVTTDAKESAENKAEATEKKSEAKEKGEADEKAEKPEKDEK